MKTEQQQEAIRLRKEGRSVRDIERTIGVARSSVSRWVSGITLTEEQKANLRPCGIAAGAVNKARFLEERLGFQSNGRVMARQSNPLHLIGCMLYWAEGNKQKNCMKFSNTDVNMMRLFVRFLRECYLVRNDEIAVFINCYTDQSSVMDTENFWLDSLGLDRSNLRKTLFDYDSRGRGSVRRKHAHGTCAVAVHSTEIVQSIFGAIQEYGGFEEPGWVNAVYGSYEKRV